MKNIKNIRNKKIFIKYERYKKYRKYIKYIIMCKIYYKIYSSVAKPRENRRPSRSRSSFTDYRPLKPAGERHAAPSSGLPANYIVLAPRGAIWRISRELHSTCSARRHLADFPRTTSYLR